ncbi:hypothetical protein [Kitasatospora sp. NPDC088346]|uniref:hypothetical protein n=1 Tax=Kitasatospora sp. NPDC088346 TaxID=3364073 RepID=UPI00381C6A24
MGSVIVLLAGLAAAATAATVFLSHRDRGRSRESDDPTGFLIEQQRTANAAALRGTYSSNAVHHGTGLASDALHKYYS